MEIKYPHNTEASVSRQHKIEDCLLLYMKEKPYSQISIADMCREMGISRRLYYTYFPDKDSCLYSLVDRMIADSIDTIPNSSRNISQLEAMTLRYLTYWRAHSDFLDVVVNQDLKPLMIERYFLYFKDTARSDFLDTPELKADDSILWLYVAIRFVVLLQWHKSDYALSVEDMSARYLRMLKQPLIQKLM